MRYKRKHMEYLLPYYFEVVDGKFHDPDNGPGTVNNGRFGYLRTQLDRAEAYLGHRGGLRYARYVLGFTRGMLAGLDIFAAFDYDNHDKDAKTAAEGK